MFPLNTSAVSCCLKFRVASKNEYQGGEFSFKAAVMMENLLLRSFSQKHSQDVVLAVA